MALVLWWSGLLYFLDPPRRNFNFAISTISNTVSKYYLLLALVT